MRFDVLFVCTGNVCRSPAAQRLFSAWADPGAPVTARSAGLAALVGDGIDDGTVDALRQLGVDPAGHHARQFAPAMAAEADLILTAQIDQRDVVIQSVPRAHRRVFTVTEFAALLAGRSPAAPWDAVGAAAERRTSAGSLVVDGAPVALDLPDPYRGGPAAARPVVAAIAASVYHALMGLSLAPADWYRQPPPAWTRLPTVPA